MTNVHSWLRIIPFVAVSVAANAFGATFTPTTTADDHDVNPGNGVCSDSSSRCTLRAAIEESNALAGFDYIVLDALDYQYDNSICAVHPTNDTNPCVMQITDSVEIDGVDRALTAITSNGLSAVLEVNAPSAFVLLTAMRLKNGNSDHGISFLHGRRAEGPQRTSVA